MNRLLDQFADLQSALAVCRKSPALIGALALAAHGLVRPTDNVDLLVDSEDEPDLHASLLAMGYECRLRTSEAGSYRRGEDALHLMHAHRPLARRLLAEAQVRDTPVGRFPVVSGEGLVACKLQGWVNNPARQQDLDDIARLLVLKSGQMDMAEIRGYFELFDCEHVFTRLVAGSVGECTST